MSIFFLSLDNTLINNAILSQNKYAWISALSFYCLSSTIFSISSEFVLLNMGVCSLFPIL
uniref:Polymorphic outer membrane protein repeat-containing protein n=1 Tax=uncultured marine Nitrospinaceae bacterium TaxID=482920 RepID=A4GJ26_9BACT|nr:polymorphic outer membrane protein repeat-containing protein [uncultured marine Nitrospinaceae bacterium]